MSNTVPAGLLQLGSSPCRKGPLQKCGGKTAKMLHSSSSTEAGKRSGCKHQCYYHEWCAGAEETCAQIKSTSAPAELNLPDFHRMRPKMKGSLWEIANEYLPGGGGGGGSTGLPNESTMSTSSWVGLWPPAAQLQCHPPCRGRGTCEAPRGACEGSQQQTGRRSNRTGAAIAAANGTWQPG